MTVDRRRFLQLLSFTVGSKLIWLSPNQAYSQQVSHKVLSSSEVNTLEKIADAFVPGSRDAGVSYFIDHHLSVSAEDSLLMIRYLGVPAPFLDFYRTSLIAAEKYSRDTYQQNIVDLSEKQFTDMVNAIAQGNIDNWDGPPAAFFYFVLRSDAIDVVYGTEEGFENLDFPYMAHIQPPDKW
jgi:hypothetical protein